MKFRIKHVDGDGYYLEVKSGWLSNWDTIDSELRLRLSGWRSVAGCSVNSYEAIIQRKLQYLDAVKPKPKPKTTYTYLQD